MIGVDTKVDIKTDKREESLKNAGKNILGPTAVGMGSHLCGSGAWATSFGDVRASDERALDTVLRLRNGGAGATASYSIGGSVGGRSSPANTDGKPVRAPALRDDISFETGVRDIGRLGKLAGTTRKESDLFINTGFLVEQIDRERAARIMEEVIKSHLKNVWGGKGLLKFVDASGYEMSAGSDVVRFGGLFFAGLYSLDGVENDRFYVMGLKANWFVNRWRLEDIPTADEFNRLTKALAWMLLDGDYSTGPLRNGGSNDGGGGCSSVLGSTFSSGNDERAGGEGHLPITIEVGRARADEKSTKPQTEGTRATSKG